jgi:hypothetical protein
MDDLLSQIEAASSANLYYLALATALMVPDICAAMAAPDGRATADRYAAWFDRYVAPQYTVGPGHVPNFSGADGYMFRCAFLHQGRLQHPKLGYSRILFLEPNEQLLIMHNNVMNDALNIDVRIFCADIVNGARRWQVDVVGSTVVEANRQLFVQRYPDGLVPFVDGFPVIA